MLQESRARPEDSKTGVKSSIRTPGAKALFFPSSVKGKVDREEYLDADYISSVYVHHSLHKVVPLAWRLLMTCV